MRRASQKEPASVPTKLSRLFTHDVSEIIYTIGLEDMSNRVNFEQKLSVAPSGAHVLTVVMVGSLNASKADSFYQQLIRVIESQPQVIRLDVSRVDQVDATGLKTLTILNKKAFSLQVELILVNPARPLLAFLDMTRLTDIFRLECPAGTCAN